MNPLNSISRDWAVAAMAVAEGQGSLPDSPAEMVNGDLQFCAAACVAYAGLKITQPGQEQVFRLNLSASNDKRIVVDAFASLGLPAVVCSQTMNINDSTPQQLRIEVLRQALGM